MDCGRIHKPRMNHLFINEIASLACKLPLTPFMLVPGGIQPKLFTH